MNFFHKRAREILGESEIDLSLGAEKISSRFRLNKKDSLNLLREMEKNKLIKIKTKHSCKVF